MYLVQAYVVVVYVSDYLRKKNVNTHTPKNYVQ